MSGSDKGSNPPNPTVFTTDKLWVEAVAAELFKKMQLHQTFTAESSHALHVVQDAEASKRAQEKRDGKRKVEDVGQAAEHSEGEDEFDDGDDLEPIDYSQVRRPANRRAQILDEDIMMGYRTPPARRPRAAGHPRPRHNQHTDVDDGLGNLKIRIPSFDGKIDPDAYLEWEKRMENVFDVQNFSERKKVMLAATEFTGYALHWWDQIVINRRRTGEPPVASWLELKRLMKRRFVPTHYNREVHQKLRRLTQGLKSVDDYFQEMETLMIRANVDEDEYATMARFQAGLNREIQDHLEMYDYADIYEMLHKANLIERRLKRKLPSRNFQPSFRPKSEQQTSKPREDSKPIQNASGDKSKSTANRSRDVRCFRCQGFGHYASDCTNKKVMTVLDNGEVVSEDGLSIESEEESCENPIYGQLMVTRRSLAVQVKPSEIDQRENLFHTRCLVSDKICSLIIDSGSCTNVASDVFVEKTGLPTTSHPTPYKLQWLNENGELPVTKQVSVPFSIGRYSDMVLCDVVPMDSSHLLLGRPWQFDKKAIHDGFRNRYSFNHNAKKIVLAPLSPQEVYADQMHLRRQKSEAQKVKSPRPENSSDSTKGGLGRKV